MTDVWHLVDVVIKPAVTDPELCVFYTFSPFIVGFHWLCYWSLVGLHISIAHARLWFRKWHLSVWSGRDMLRDDNTTPVANGNESSWPTLYMNQLISHPHHLADIEYHPWALLRPSGHDNASLNMLMPRPIDVTLVAGGRPRPIRPPFPTVTG